MERRNKCPYSLHRRPTSKPNRFVYYARFRGPDGSYRSAVSTGASNRDDAVRWAEDCLEEAMQNAEAVHVARGQTTFAEYARGFWSPTGAYASARDARGYTVTRGYLDACESVTRNHLHPAWGLCPLRELTAGRIDRWVVSLRQEGRLAPATVNRALQALRLILAQALADDLLTENPAAAVKPVKAKSAERGILTPTEVFRLLAEPGPWGDFRHWTINLLAATTGMRMGEVRGLLVENLLPDHVRIRTS